MDDLQLALKQIAKDFDIKLTISGFKTFCNPHMKTITLAMIRFSDDEMVSNFFHELGHFLDFDKGKYKTYFNLNPHSKRFKKTMLQAEYSADRNGKRLMNAYFPDLTFIPGYALDQEESNIKFLTEWWNL